MHGKEPAGDFGFVGTVVALMITLSVITIIHLLFTEAEELLIKYETVSGKLECRMARGKCEPTTRQKMKRINGRKKLEIEIQWKLSELSRYLMLEFKNKHR